VKQEKVDCLSLNRISEVDSSAMGRTLPAAVKQGE